MSFNLTIEDYPRYTYKDYEIWDGDWELIRGIPYAMRPAPNRHHQRFGSQFVTTFSNALNQNAIDCNCDVLYETDWKVSDDTVVRPDVMIVCEEIKGNFVTDPPSLILEILSPATILKDRNTKFNLYQAYGVRYYLIADLGKRQVEIFQLQNNLYQEKNDLNEFNLTRNYTVNFSVQQLLA
ncbi:Uma2 family endonuclease [Flavisolibacter sp. BT320]|nr:Uma2 family endonuclease [Flavisolibacter longurius]